MGFIIINFDGKNSISKSYLLFCSFLEKLDRLRRNTVLVNFCLEEPLTYCLVILDFWLKLTLEFSLNAFTEFAEFSDEKF